MASVLRSRLVRPENSAEREITGRIDEITQTFNNNDGTTAIIARLSDGRTIRGTVDDVEEIEEGGFYYLSGRWDEHSRYGWQFCFQSHVVDIPRVESGSVAYLTRHCTGIGDKTARKLVEAYGDKAVMIVIDEPHRTVEDEILRADVAAAASKSLREVCDPALRSAHQELSRFFYGGGFPRKLIGKCLKEFGKEAPVRIKRDPFVLLTRRMPGCGFLRTDKLYMKLGHSPHRLKRQTLAAVYDIKSRDGDTWIRLTKGIDAIRTRIGGTTARPQRAIALAYRAGLVAFHMDKDGDCWIADRTRATNEQKLAHNVQILRNVDRVCWPTTPPPGLSDHQQAEIVKATASPVGILTGGPGTGKTFTAAAVIKALADGGCLKEIAVCAPTGKAAVRVGQKLHDAGLAKLERSAG
jgi:exodeoxyribonuclease V alpha subunit